MTLGSLMHWSGFGKTPVMHPIERYHSGSGGYWEHKSHSRGGKGKGGGSGAALSALTLLAFLFLINVMQQSMQENNSTMTPATGATTLLLREGQQPVSLDGREETGQKLKSLRELETSISSSGASNSKSKKGDTLDSALNGQIYVIPIP